MENSLGKVKTTLFALLVVAVLGGIVYYNRGSYSYAIKNVLVNVGITKPCGSTLTYSIGRFDSGFNISQTQFLAVADRAAQLWNTAAGKTVLAYADSGGEVTVNLEYDARQRATDKVNTIGNSIDDRTATYHNIQASYKSMTASYQAQKAQLIKLQVTYNNDLASYQSQANYWTAHGRATPAQMASLEKQRETVNADAAAVNQAEQTLNTLVAEINGTAAQLNGMASDINQQVATYNTVSSTTGREFDEGEYISDKTGERINVYQYADENKLLRVMAHEFGHALGLDHVSDPQAIMYMVNAGDGTSLTAADVAELKRVCTSLK